MHQQLIELDVGDLHLDPASPRLPRALHHSSDQEIIDWMLQDASLIELMLAIGTNGYFAGEPLLVTQENGRNIVVEGNRRLSSLILLQNPLFTQVQKNKIHQVMELTKQRPVSIPCIMFASRSEIEKHLGFKHATGVKPWSILSKALYLAKWAETLTSPTRRELCRELAKNIGSKGDYVGLLLVAFELYCIIEDNDFFNIPDLDETSLYLGSLVDFLNRPNIREFMGVDLKSETPTINLKKEACFKNFKELISWFFRKNKFNKTVLKADSQSLTNLDAVLGHLEAKQKFLDSGNLQAATEITIETASSYHHDIAQALLCLENAQAKIYKVKPHNITDVSVLEDVIGLAERLKNAKNVSGEA